MTDYACVLTLYSNNFNRAVAGTALRMTIRGSLMLTDLLERLNIAGVIICWARELSDPSAGALWISEYAVLVLNASAKASMHVESCEELLSFISASGVA